MWEQLLVYIEWGVTAEKLAKMWGPQNATSMVNRKTGKEKSFHFQERQAENLLILSKVVESIFNVYMPESYVPGFLTMPLFISEVKGN